MKTSTTTPRTPRKTTPTAKTVPAGKTLTAPRLRRTTKKAPASTGAAGAQRPSPSTEDVRYRAYQIYLGRNGQGDEVSDWLQAERELSAQAG